MSYSISQHDHDHDNEQHKTESLHTHITQSAYSSGGSHVAALVKGFNWTGSIGQATTVTYSYNTSFFSENSSHLNGAQQQAAQQALQSWASVANIRFSETSGSQADIAIRQADLPSGIAGVAMTSYSGAQMINSEINIDNSQQGFTPGGSAYFTFLHEIGHALGLKHAGNYNSNDSGPTLSSSEDNWDASVMSYRQGNYANVNNFSAGPMIYDIAAAQYLYGANHSYNAGNNTYIINGAQLTTTLWDGNGNDMLDASSTHSGGIIDLREGLGNITHIGSTTLWMAFGANIENAKGSHGHDTIHGNNLSNLLYGKSGRDNLFGYNGDDILKGNRGRDTIDGSNGNDTLQGGKGRDLVIGGNGDDLLKGGKGYDTLQGNGGNDTLIGGAGRDTLTGGAGSDTFIFSLFHGSDVIQDFNTSADKIQIASNIFLSTQQAVNAISYNGSNAFIDFGSGHNVTLIGISGGLDNSDFLIG